MDDGQDVHEDRRAVQLAPQLRADAAAGVEGEPERRGEVAADDPEPGEERLVVHDERDRDADRPGMQPRVAEQRDAVHGDRDQPRQRGVLVQRHQPLREPGLLERLAGHRKPDADRERDQRQRDQP